MSVDVLALRFDRTTRRIELGIAARAQDPFRGQLALPGVLLGLGERLQDAAMRALTGKLGVPTDSVRGIGQLVTFDKPNRDPRGPTLSVAMWAGVDQAGGAAVWTPLDDFRTWRSITNGSSRTVGFCWPARCGGTLRSPDR